MEGPVAVLKLELFRIHTPYPMATLPLFRASLSEPRIHVHEKPEAVYIYTHIIICV